MPFINSANFNKRNFIHAKANEKKCFKSEQLDFTCNLIKLSYHKKFVNIRQIDKSA